MCTLTASLTKRRETMNDLTHVHSHRLTDKAPRPPKLTPPTLTRALTAAP